MTESTRLYMRNVYDHTVQVIDTLETLRETVAEMLDVYLSNMSNRMAAVMKVLTIITTIFIGCHQPIDDLSVSKKRWF